MYFYKHGETPVYCQYFVIIQCNKIMNYYFITLNITTIDLTTTTTTNSEQVGHLLANQ